MTNNHKRTHATQYNPHKSLQYMTKSVTTWLICVMLGQWIFAAYIAVGFAIPVLSGTSDESTFSHMIKGQIEGDWSGNLILYLHLLPAAVISFCGIIQFVPSIRKSWPRIHRFNGRLFLTIGLLGAITGLYLTWVRDTRLSDLSSLGITLNGILIPIAVYFAWKFARHRRFDLHQRYAVHAFLLINGVWTFRLYLMAWFFVNQGYWGNTQTLDGPVDLFFTFACYLLPMCVAELYFWAKRTQSRTRLLVANTAITVGVAITALGVFSATMMMWLPRITA